MSKLTELLKIDADAKGKFKDGAGKIDVDAFLSEVAPNTHSYHQDVFSNISSGREIGATGNLAGDLASIESHATFSSGGHSAFNLGGSEAVGKVGEGKLPFGVKSSARTAHREFDAMARNARKAGEKLFKELKEAHTELAKKHVDVLADIEKLQTFSKGTGDAAAAAKLATDVQKNGLTAAFDDAKRTWEIVIGEASVEIGAKDSKAAKDAAKRWFEQHTELLKDAQEAVVERYGDLKEFVLESRGKITEATGIANKYGKTAEENLAKTENSTAKYAEAEAKDFAKTEAKASAGMGHYLGAAAGLGLVAHGASNLMSGEEQSTGTMAVNVGEVGLGAYLSAKSVPKILSSLVNTASHVRV